MIIINQNNLTDADEWFEISFNKLFNQKIKEGGYIKSWVCIVDSYNSTTQTANVHLPNDAVNIIPNIKNKSNVTLIAGDIVELHSRLSTLGSSYIAVKY